MIIDAPTGSLASTTRLFMPCGDMRENTHMTYVYQFQENLCLYCLQLWKMTNILKHFLTWVILKENIVHQANGFQIRYLTWILFSLSSFTSKEMLNIWDTLLVVLFCFLICEYEIDLWWKMKRMWKTQTNYIMITWLMSISYMYIHFQYNLTTCDSYTRSKA